jgi:hypothetical protein
VTEEVSEEVDIGHGISKAISDHPGRQPIHEGGPQCLVAALPVMHRMEEEVLVAHDSFINYDG